MFYRDAKTLEIGEGTNEIHEIRHISLYREKPLIGLRQTPQLRKPLRLLYQLSDWVQFRRSRLDDACFAVVASVLLILARHMLEGQEAGTTKP